MRSTWNGSCNIAIRARKNNINRYYFLVIACSKSLALLLLHQWQYVSFVRPGLEINDSRMEGHAILTLRCMHVVMHHFMKLVSAKQREQLIVTMQVLSNRNLKVASLASIS
jgi:hypothetical protein